MKPTFGLLNRLRNALSGRKELKKALFNFNWLVLNQVVMTLTGVFVGIWVARHLTPKGFGELNFYLSFAALFTPISALGLQGIVVRDLVSKPSKINEILGSALLLKTIGGALHVIIAAVGIALLRPEHPYAIVFTIIAASHYLFKLGDILDWWFQHIVASKYVVYANMSSVLTVSVLKIILILLGAPLIAFLYTFPIQALIFTIVLTVIFLCRANTPFRNWTPKLAAIKHMLKEAAPLMVSSTAVIIYVRIDQVMIGQMLDNASLGQYSASVRLLESFGGLGIAFITSVFPAFMKAKQDDPALFRSRLRSVFDLVLWIAITISITTMAIADWLVPFVFGKTYDETATILKVMIWAAPFMFFGVTNQIYVMAEKLTNLLALRVTMGAVLNILLNIILIPTWGTIGAAVATVFTQAMAGFITNALFRETRPYFMMMLNSFNIFGVYKRLKKLLR